MYIYIKGFGWKVPTPDQPAHYPSGFGAARGSYRPLCKCSHSLTSCDHHAPTFGLVPTAFDPVLLYVQGTSLLLPAHIDPGLRESDLR